MSIIEMAKEMEIDLYELQTRYADAIEWLLSWDSFSARTGRSTLLALGFIFLALRNKGKTIRFFDHANPEETMKEYIKDLIKDLPQHTFELTNNSIICRS